ncbi:MAG: amidohydrolase family protein [Firmicutes bacterium]|nr:amidohydrolase family protein [Bacillota bacterium]
MLLIKNATINTIEDKEPINDGYILLKENKIFQVGKMSDFDLKSYEKKVSHTIDALGKQVYPGFIDAHTHLGIANVGLRWEGADYNEISDPVTPQMRTVDGIYGFDDSFRDTMIGGVTTVVVCPGSANVVGGVVCAIKTGGSNIVDEMIVDANLAMKCAFGENPKNVFGQSQKKAPFTRMATASLLREILIKTKEYDNKLKNATKDKPVDINIKYEAMLPVVRREIPIHIHCHRADDICTAIRIGKEFDLRLVLVHATEASLVAQHIKSSGYPAIIGPTMTHKSKPEVKNKGFGTLKSLLDIGVLACCTTDHPVIPLQHINICAALTSQAGLDKYQALKAITIYAAEIIGLQDRLGSIKVGKDADLVLWDGHPFDATAKATNVIINGKVVY